MKKRIPTEIWANVLNRTLADLSNHDNVSYDFIIALIQANLFDELIN